MSNELILVTGGSGFLATHTIVAALAAGHRVRTTLRSASRADELLHTVTLAKQDVRNLEIVTANLSADEGWTDAAAGVDRVLHLASPFPATPPKDPQELIRPAVDGTLRVLRAAHEAGVRRVVMTSSFAAVGYGHDAARETFTEADWTDPDARGIRPYVRSKTLAERAAWDFVRDTPRLELTTVNPVAIFGPLLSQNAASSVEVVRLLLNGQLPGVPRLAFGVVDVRDVADLHLRAMDSRQAAGQRYLAVAGPFMTMGQIAGTLRDGLGHQARHVPTRVLPDALVRVGGLFSPALADFVPQLGQFRNATAEKAVRELGWQPRLRERTLLDTAHSLIARGLAGGD